MVVSSCRPTWSAFREGVKRNWFDSDWCSQSVFTTHSSTLLLLCGGLAPLLWCGQGDRRIDEEKDKKSDAERMLNVTYHWNKLSGQDILYQRICLNSQQPLACIANQQSHCLLLAIASWRQVVYNLEGGDIVIPKKILLDKPPPQKTRTCNMSHQ